MTEAERIAKEWPDFPYSENVDIVNEAKPKQYCGLHHNGFYGDCQPCLLKAILLKWNQVAHLLSFLRQS